MDDFIPFEGTFGTDPGLFIEDFPDYLMTKVKEWMRQTLASRALIVGTHVSDKLADPLEFRLRTTLSRNVGSFIAYFTSDTNMTRNFISYILQYHADHNDADRLKQLLRDASSAYTVEMLPEDESRINGGYILVRRVAEAERMQAQAALATSDLLRDAYIAAYKIQPDYAEAVRKASDHIEGLLTNKFWNGRTSTYSISVAVRKFQEDPSILRFKADTFLTDKTKLIGLLEGVAAIREEHTTGTGRAPTPDEAEFVVQTAIYIHNLIEPIQPLSE